MNFGAAAAAAFTAAALLATPVFAADADSVKVRAQQGLPYRAAAAGLSSSSSSSQKYHDSSPVRLSSCRITNVAAGRTLPSGGEGQLPSTHMHASSQSAGDVNLCLRCSVARSAAQ